VDMLVRIAEPLRGGALLNCRTFSHGFCTTATESQHTRDDGQTRAIIFLPLAWIAMPCLGPERVLSPDSFGWTGRKPPAVGGVT
jgi:hypothetical protein